MSEAARIDLVDIAMTDPLKNNLNQPLFEYNGNKQ